AALNGTWVTWMAPWWSPGCSGNLTFVSCVVLVYFYAGNILVIVIVAATKTFHSVTSVLIMNLAISDLLVGVGVMPFVALSIINRGWVNCADLCLYVGYTSSVYCTASVLTLAAIALDRYHSIIDCLRYSSRCTLWRTCAVVLWIWLQALATSCPPLLGWSSVSYVVPINPSSAFGLGDNNHTSRRFFSFLHHNHHGVVRLFLVISAFFLCWTPYIGVALVQATETAISGQSSLIPPSAVTFSYWLVLLNSDINPLLYALGGEVRAEGEDGRSSVPCTLSTTHPCPPSSSENSTCDDSKYSTSIFTVSTDYKQSSKEHLCKMCHPQNTSSSSVWRDAGGDSRVDCLQVPSRPQEGSRAPFSALTKEPQATFFYNQITVRVEHPTADLVNPPFICRLHISSSNVIIICCISV
uniref:5-hydroxytryptamine receptor 1D-like n=1 Tax=Mastacembelus armatus TaxID=205130 RepID=A0A3Q3SXJ3_9TELE